MTSYRLFLLLSSGFGALPASIFVVLFAFFDRPKYKDRYASLLLGLGMVAFIGFFIPFLLTLFGSPPITPDAAWRWIVSIAIRGSAGAFMWWLLWIYLTPERARIRLGRFGSTRKGSELE